MPDDAFPGIVTVRGDGIAISDSVRESKKDAGLEVCGICKFAQRTGGFKPGLTCLNRRSENYLHWIDWNRAACSKIDKKEQKTK